MSRPYPEARLDGVSYEQAFFNGGFSVTQRLANHSYCYLLRRGELILNFEAPWPEKLEISAGSIFTVSGLTPHIISSTTDSPLLPSDLAEHILPLSENTSAAVELIVGRVEHEALSFSGAYSGPQILNPSNAGRHLRRIWQLYHLIEEELKDTEAYSEVVVRNYSEAISVHLNRYIKASQSRRLSADQVRADRRILRVMTQIGSDPCRTWTLAHMAAVAGMSRTGFAMEFKRVLGSTPLRAVTHARLAKAIFELDNSTKSIEKIAYDIGYGSSAAFIRAFQRAFGTTPAKWRNTR